MPPITLEAVQAKQSELAAPVRAKRLREDLDDEEASRIEALLSAAQQEDREKPVYREVVQPVEFSQQGVQT